MIWHYAYTPQFWPALVTLALVIFLLSYSWARRTVRGAKPISIAFLFGALWALGVVLEVSTVESSGKVFWIKFETLWQLPAVTATLVFVVTYAGLGRWINRRNLALLALPTLVVAVAVLTNDWYHLQYAGFRIDSQVTPVPGKLYWVFVGYAYLLGIVNVILLVWLLAKSQRRRWPVAIMLGGQLVARGWFVVDKVNTELLGPGDSIFFVVGVLCSAYAFAFFRFHVIDPILAGRAAVLEQMSEGMLVLDLGGRIAELNSTAARFLGASTGDLRGRAATEVLPANLGALPRDRVPIHAAMSLGSGTAARHYEVNLTPLNDRRGETLGQLLLLHDVTDQKRAQQQLLEQQRALATLQERERLARELHDGVGQVLGYVSMQAQSASKWVHDGNTEKAEKVLGRLAEVAQDAHADVRESILNLRSGTAQEWSFISVLRQYLESFQANYGIKTELSMPPTIEGSIFSHEAGVQLLRVVQEALTNARKHSGAQSVAVGVELADGLGRITIADNGHGFDAGDLDRNAGAHFGLIFMRERMQQIGGSMRVESKPGAGTTVKLEAPIAANLENNG